jgi:hypothetical protein
MIPTFLILVAAALSMADLALPASQDAYTVAAAEPTRSAEAIWDDRPAE